MRANFGNYCIIEDEVTLFPHPDSPTIHNVFPFFISNETPLMTLLQR